jgi:hypothetical protein
MNMQHRWGAGRRENDRLCPAQLLLRRRTLLAGVGRARATLLHPLFPPGLHFVPLLLLIRVEERADLRIGFLVDLHHLGVAILLGERSVLVHALHLGALGLKSILHFGLLIGSEIELFGQFRRAPGGVRRAVVPAAVVLWRLVGAILGRSEGSGNRNEAGRDKYEQELLEHEDLLCEATV